MMIRSLLASNQEILYKIYYIIHRDILGFISSLCSLDSLVGEEVSISSRLTKDLLLIYLVESIASEGTTTIMSGIVYC